MKERSPIIAYEYDGVLAGVCGSFVAEKRALGCLYNTEAKQLREFSRFSTEFSLPANTLTEEVVQAWIAKRPNDSDRGRYARMQLLKMFAEYMRRMGYPAFRPDKEDLGKIQWAYTPYIFTHDEIRRFFAAGDALEHKLYSMSPRRHIVMPIIFRLLYCCGLRCSEATGLRTKDVSLADGILTVRESKFGKTRYVPLSAELLQTCKAYAAASNLTPEGFFLPAPDGGAYDTRSVYSVYRDILWGAGISHGGRGKGPRLHDFRHTFAVHCLEQWASMGKELSTALPRLSAYLGHSDMTATERYLRMTAEVYPEITAKLDELYGYIVPKAGDTQ